MFIGEIMRLRNIKNKKEILDNSNYIISNPNDLKGTWQKLFANTVKNY